MSSNSGSSPQVAYTRPLVTSGDASVVADAGAAVVVVDAGAVVVVVGSDGSLVSSPTPSSSPESPQPERTNNSKAKITVAVLMRLPSLKAQ
jgi:hypothetical protein